MPLFKRYKLLRQAVMMSLAVYNYSCLAGELTVSAAASLSNAFKDLTPAFEAKHPGAKLHFNFAASDALLAQIAKGAPADVFAAADEQTMDRAEAQLLLVAGSRRNFARNSLVVITPAKASVALTSLADLQKSDVKRFAMGKPDGVPAGRYAKSALQAAQLWPIVEAKAIYAQNVRQALDYVARGEVEAGFVYATDAAQQFDKVRIAITVPTVIAITYPAAAVAGSPNSVDARKFLEFLSSPVGQAVLARHGFQKP